MDPVERIYSMIGWDKSEESQKEGIALARDIPSIAPFFKPIALPYSKNIWDNCAVIIAERSDAELIPYIPQMLDWLEDLNWPGAEIVQNRLIAFEDCTQLASQLDKLVAELSGQKRIRWLLFLSDLLKNETLCNALKKETIDVLREVSTSF